jgi:hypothetical protein
LEGKRHNLWVKEGDRRNFVQGLISIAGIKHYFGDGMVPDQTWEGQTMKIRTRGRSQGIQFSNAFGSVPQEMIGWNMIKMGIPATIVDPIMNIYEGCEIVIATPGVESEPISWTSGTVQMGGTRTEEDGTFKWGEPEQIPMETSSLYLGTAIAFNREGEAKHAKHIFDSMKENILAIGRSHLNITQKLRAIKTFELPRIDFRMMCGALHQPDLRRFDSWMRGQIMGWL